MKKNISKKKAFVKFFTYIVLSLFISGAVFAQGDFLLEEMQKIEEEFSDYQKNRFSERYSEGSSTLKQIRKVVNGEYDKFYKSLETSKDMEEKITAAQDKIADLKGQIENINLQLKESKKRIKAIQDQIAMRKIDLEAIYEEQEKIQAESDAQRKVILKYFNQLQQEQIKNGADNSENTVRFLLADASFSEYLQNEIYVSAWEKAERQIFHGIEYDFFQSDEAGKITNRQRAKFEELQKLLAKEKKNLQIQKTAQANLVKQTRGEQEEYKKLWGESRKQMMESAESIKGLRSEMQMIHEKLQILEEQKRKQLQKVAEKNKKKENKNNSEKSSDTISKEENSEEIFEVGKIFENEDAKKTYINWPINPAKGVSAYYHDHGYEKRFGVAHEAIDIRCDQGTVVKAPALGYVYEVADNGMGYSYVITVHKNNLTTVYGHLSKIIVKEGNTVQAGDPIGLSGGTPGTKGAGVMTTGPHLHLEVIDNGIHKNPLEYLPIEELPIQYVPEKFLRNYDF